MRVSFFFITMAIALVLWQAPSAQCQGTKNTGKNGDEIAPSACRMFFESHETDLPPMLIPFVALPAGPTALKASPYMMRYFAGAARAFLRSDFVPSVQFITDNIRLYPADRVCCSDRMVVVFRKGDTDYMIVLDVLHLYFFAKRNEPERESLPWGTRPPLDLIRDYLIVPPGDEPPVISARPQGSIGVFQVNLLGYKGRSRLRALQGAVSRNEFALAISAHLPGHVPAVEPAPNAWFEDLLKSEKEREAVDKLVEERYSPENVERERRELEKNSF